MSVVIPVDNSLTSQEIEVVLDGNPYNINLTYNDRYDFWTMSFLTLEDVKLVSGIKVVLGYPLLRQWVDKGLPAGEIIATDTTDNEIDVNRDNFGEIVQLVYLTEEEVDAVQ